MNAPAPTTSDIIAGKLQHRTFDAVVLLKGLNGLVEFASGIALLLVTNAAILSWVRFLTQPELSEDPRDFIANVLVHWAESFGHDSKMYVAAYLMLHGAAKISLAVLLMHGTKWAYPVAVGFIGLFIAYAAHRLTLGWSFPLAAIIALDVFTLWIIIREWRAHTSVATKPRQV